MTQQTMTRADESTTTALDITVRTGSGSGRTLLSAFDRALQGAGVADFNLVTLSSVIPASSRISMIESDQLQGAHGDLLYCVRSEAYAERPGEFAWAGLGWCVDETGAGLFVEHHGGSQQALEEQIELSLADMKSHREADYGEVQMAIASAHCVDTAVCAVVVAAYRVDSWSQQTTTPSPAARAASSMPATAPAIKRGDQRDPVSPLRITVEKEVDYATAHRFYQLYRETFQELETQAAARQVLHQSEFLEQMVNSRIKKFVVWEGDRAIGLSTTTSDLDAVPWISPAYFAARYPEQYTRDAVFYLGYTLVEKTRQRARTFALMVEQMIAQVVAVQGVAAWDICMWNDEQGLGGHGASVLKGFADLTVERIDHQNYYAGVVNVSP